jgi:hypothetical protein
MHYSLNLPTGTLLMLSIPLVALELILLLVALVDLIRREPERIRGSKLMWVLVVLLASILGPILYFVLGRKEQEDDRI